MSAFHHPLYITARLLHLVKGLVGNVQDLASMVNDGNLEAECIPQVFDRLKEVVWVQASVKLIFISLALFLFLFGRHDLFVLIIDGPLESRLFNPAQPSL